MIQEKTIYSVYRFDANKNDWVLFYQTENKTFAEGWTKPGYKVVEEKIINELPEPKIGRIFFDKNLCLWTLCLYDENDMIIDECHYDHYKKDAVARMKDYPTVEVWEVGKRR